MIPSPSILLGHPRRRSPFVPLGCLICVACSKLSCTARWRAYPSRSNTGSLSLSILVHPGGRQVLRGIEKMTDPATRSPDYPIPSFPKSHRPMHRVGETHPPSLVPWQCPTATDPPAPQLAGKASSPRPHKPLLSSGYTYFTSSRDVCDSSATLPMSGPPSFFFLLKRKYEVLEPTQRRSHVPFTRDAADERGVPSTTMPLDFDELPAFGERLGVSCIRGGRMDVHGFPRHTHTHWTHTHTHPAQKRETIVGLSYLQKFQFTGASA